MYNPDDPQSVEKYSSAITLSDMEVFVFPDLMFSLVLANIMSPLLWEWKKDPWFKKQDKMNDYRRILRAKQFIMDRFTFNLDLDTWGLTSKEKEMARFSDYIDESVLASSNALFGYEGNKYYFDIDIRRHFGLDKYTTNIIPYWKTETIEAMEAFKHRDAYTTSAGECISLAALYASTLYVITGIPLDKIYMLATPLHSQNFVDIKDGIITNNRRIVSKNMWFNGTELSAKARRALENERVTIVVHNGGYIHTLYNEATMSPDAYRHLSTKLRQYLKTDINFEILANFLRQNNKIQKCFQLVHNAGGKSRYIEAEKAFHYEHGSKSRIGDATQAKLLNEIDIDEYYTDPLTGRFVLDEIESFFKNNRNISIDSRDNIEQLKGQLSHCCYNVEEVIDDLINFCRTNPRLPDTAKKWVQMDPINIDHCTTRDEIVDHLESIRATNEVADLAFMAYRDMSRSPWKPFIKAALERSPAGIDGATELDIGQVAEKLWMMANQSIYDGSRMAQPDEVWNFERGDGLEKALCLMNIIKSRFPDDEITLKGDNTTICLVHRQNEYLFQTTKKVPLPEKDDFIF